MANAGSSNVTQYNATVARKIQELFEHYVQPSNVLRYFHKYNAQVLTQRDMENVRARVKEYGEIDGAILLLERLVKYENWFDCLLSVLRDPEVKLEHVAVKMETEKVELDTEWPEEPPSLEPESEQFARCSETNRSFHLTRKTNEQTGESPEEEDMEVVDANSLECDMAAAAAEDFTLVNDSECEEEGEDPVDAVTATTEPTESQNTERKQIVDSSATSAAQADQTSATQADEEWQTVGMQHVPDKGHAKTRRMRKSSKPAVNHGPQYDYAQEDVAAKLGQFPGWRAQIHEKQIWHILMPYCGEDGHYVIWYWERKKRPAMSVTLGKEVKTFTVHKKPDRDNVGKARYHFVIKKDVTHETLPGIVQYHLKNGVKNVVKRFQYPVPPEQETAL